jgi:hypothetical protein
MRALTGSLWLVCLALVHQCESSPSGPTNLNYTCKPLSPESSLPFCDRSLGFKARAADLAKRLNISEHTDLFFSYPSTKYVERFNMKTWSLDHTCIHGLNKASGVTVFPHAIAQGATWDIPLVQRISNVTAIEARILSAKSYMSTHGQNSGGALSCDGGPVSGTPRNFAIAHLSSNLNMCDNVI